MPEQRWLLLQHADHAAPGLLATLAATHGLSLDVVRPDRDEEVPEHAEGLGGVIVLGGPMGVEDTRRYPWLAVERALLADAVHRELPVWATGLGAQQLAAALGGSVVRGVVPEVGIGSVTLTAEGEADPVMGVAGTTPAVLHLHRDSFVPPPGAVRLAGNDRFEDQAFRVGPRAYGVQFHVELDTSLVVSLTRHYAGVLAMDEAPRTAVEAAGRRILAAFFASATGR